MRVLREKYPYRWCENDFSTKGWIEKFNDTTRRWFTMYVCDSPLQLMTALEDVEYTKWLDPQGVPCYRKNRGDTVSGSRS